MGMYLFVDAAETLSAQITNHGSLPFLPFTSMFPRHLQSLVARNAISRGAYRRLLHSSSPRYNELPKSPFQTFVDVLRDELKKNRELQDNVKQLQGDVDKLQDSEAMKRAKAAYERARVCHPLFFSSYMSLIG